MSAEPMNVSPFKYKKAAIAAFLVCAFVPAGWFGWNAWSEARSPHVLLATFHTLYGDFSGGVFRFSIRDFERNLVLDHETMERYRFSDIPKNFFAQSVNPVEGGFLLTGGRPGKSPGSGKIYAIDRSGKSSVFMDTDDFRFRNIGTGSINGKSML